MEITRTIQKSLTQFRPNFYIHSADCVQNTCWRCGRDFEIDEPVHAAMTPKGAILLCTPCAIEEELPLGIKFTVFREDIRDENAPPTSPLPYGG